MNKFKANLMSWQISKKENMDQKKNYKTKSKNYKKDSYNRSRLYKNHSTG